MAANPIGSAAISWVDGNGNSNLNVYWTDGYTVRERVWTGNGWADGAFSQSGEQVSATVYQTGNGASIRVYCTFEDAMTEWCQDDGGDWYQGQFALS